MSEAGYVVPLSVGGVILAVSAVGALLLAYVGLVTCWDLWRDGADMRECRRRERIQASARAALREAADEAGRGGR